MVSALILAAVALLANSTLINPGFESGLEGWKVEGDVHLETTKPIAGKTSLLIGPGAGTVSQQYAIPGLRILFWGAKLKPSAPTVAARIRLQCFDKAGRRLMNLTASPDPKGDAGIYLKTQAFTDHVLLSIEKDKGGELLADDAVLTDDDKDRVDHAPQVDLAAIMRPIWKGDTIVNESVLLLSQQGAPSAGRLLMTPTKIISVTDSSLKTPYTEGKDFTLDGNVLTAVKGSSIPTMSDTEFAKGEFPWTTLEGHHLFVTYEHQEPWQGPIPAYGPNLLPGTLGRLKAKRPLTVVAYGDSITLGINGTGFRNVPPYQPPLPTLFAWQLGQLTGDKKIKLYNTALGGMTSEWAKDNAKEVVASLTPDLVLIAFGMNDFWSLTPEQFIENIKAAMATIRKRRPKCEFVLIASIKFDPVYTVDPTYVGHLTGYEAELRKLSAPGVAFFDMTSLSDALYKAKSAKDLMTDPMHPDDFLSRWYAQGLIQLLTGK